jgi:hypothetical protein
MTFVYKNIPGPTFTGSKLWEPTLKTPSKLRREHKSIQHLPNGLSVFQSKGSTRSGVKYFCLFVGGLHERQRPLSVPRRRGRFLISIISRGSVLRTSFEARSGQMQEHPWKTTMALAGRVFLFREHAPSSQTAMPRSCAAVRKSLSGTCKKNLRDIANRCLSECTPFG